MLFLYEFDSQSDVLGRFEPRIGADRRLPVGSSTCFPIPSHGSDLLTKLKPSEDA